LRPSWEHAAVEAQTIEDRALGIGGLGARRGKSGERDVLGQTRLGSRLSEEGKGEDEGRGRGGIVILNLDAVVRARIAFAADFKERAKLLRIARQRPVDDAAMRRSSAQAGNPARR